MADDRGCLVVHLFPYGHETRVMAEQGRRIGCGFCFRTLDPSVEDSTRRAFTQCSSCRTAYHTACQQTRCDHVGCGGSEFCDLTVMPPREADLSIRSPMRYPSGPPNALEDEPLGISHGTLIVRTDAATSFRIRNNGPTDLSVPRWRTPPWAFLHLGDEDDSSLRQLIVPGEEVEALVITAPMHPPSILADIHLGPDSRILLHTEGGHRLARLSPLAFGLVACLHWNHAWQLRGGPETGTIISFAWSFGLVVCSGVFLAPATSFWTVLRMVNALGDLPLARQLEARCRRFLSSGSLARCMTVPTSLAAVVFTSSVVCSGAATGVAAVAALLMARTNSLFEGALLLAYAAVLLVATHHLFAGYGVNPVDVARQLYSVGHTWVGRPLKKGSARAAPPRNREGISL